MHLSQRMELFSLHLTTFFEPNYYYYYYYYTFFILGKPKYKITSAS